MQKEKSKGGAAGNINLSAPYAPINLDKKGLLHPSIWFRDHNSFGNTDAGLLQLGIPSASRQDFDKFAQVGRSLHPP